MFNITNPVLMYKHFKWLRPIRLRFTPLRATCLFLMCNPFEACVALVVSGDSPALQVQTWPAGADQPNGTIPIKKYKTKKPPVLLVDFYCVKFAG